MTREAVLQWLREQGKLIREKKPPNDLIEELARLVSQHEHCSSCGHAGLASEAPESLPDDEWGGRRLCRDCRKPLDPLRLEVFPDAERCAACQQRDEQGLDAATDYCPRCGGELSVQSRGSRGTYRQTCADCGYR